MFGIRLGQGLGLRAGGVFGRLLYRRLCDLHPRWTQCVWLKLKATGTTKERALVTFEALGTFDDDVQLAIYSMPETFVTYLLA